MARLKQDIPEIRFEGFSGEWRETIIGDLLIVNSGKDYKHLEKGNIPVYGTGGYMLSVNQSLSDKDSIGIGRKGTINKPQLLKAPFWTVDTLFHLEPKKKVNLLFSYNLLQNINWLRYDESTGVPSLSKATIVKVKVNSPELEEQTQIGNFFQQLDKLIDLQTRAVESAETYKKAMLQKMFPQKGEKVPRVRFEGFSGDWSEFKIGNITSSYSGGTPSVTESSYYNGDIPFIRSGEIDSKETELFITELGLNNSSAKMVEKGDILYALYGATSGEVSRSKIKGAINQAILAIRPKTQFCSEYLCQLLGFMKDEIVNKYLQGGQGNLSGAIIKDLKITLPDLKEQTQIGNFFQKLDQNIESEKKKLEQYQTMKRALLQRMFV